MTMGYSRRELGQLHRDCYQRCMEQTSDMEAFQRSLMSMIKAMLDVIDANNQKLERDIKSMIEKTPKA